MTTMTLTLNGKLINATQCKNRYRGIEGAVTCTLNHDYLDNGVATSLTPVPPGLEVFGSTTMGVRVQNDQYQEMKSGDWYLIRNNETQGIILDDATFKYIFEDELP